MKQLRVVSSHPAKQVVVYDIAAQLAIRGHLAAHLAAVYYVPARLPYALAPYVPGDAGRQLQRQLAKRQSRALPDGLVVDWPWVELATRALQQLPGLKRLMIYGGMYATVEAAHDAFAARWIKKHRAVDIVMSYHGSALTTLHATREIGARSVLNVIHPVSPHRLVEAEYKKLGGAGPPPPSARLLREIEAADYFLTPSALTTDSLLELGIPAGRIKQIPYGIDVTDSPNHATRAAANRVRFLFVGKLSIHKGLHILRQAWSVIAASNVSLTLVGRPIGPLEADLVRTWKDDRVSSIDEIDDINDAYRQADVFVFPSLVEGFGMVTLEAMASGLPVIVTERSKAVVRDGVDGFVLRPGDADALARCMIRLAEDAGLRAELGRNAHERACQYPWKRFGSELCDWLNFVAHGHSFQGT